MDKKPERNVLSAMEWKRTNTKLKKELSTKNLELKIEAALDKVRAIALR